MGDRARGGKANRAIRPSQPPALSTSNPSTPETISAASPVATSSLKLPLPRQNVQGQPSKYAEKARVRHACEPCRQRKAKCNGAQPLCMRCEELGIVCYYADGKRERTKKTNKNFVQRVSMYEKLLSELLPFQDATRQQAIDNVLTEARRYAVDFSPEDQAASDEYEDKDEEYSAHADTHSPELQGRIGANAPGYAKSVGYLGKASTVRWIEEVSEKLHTDSKQSQTSPSRTNRRPGSPEFNELLLEAAKYHVSQLDISEFGQAGQFVSAYQLPPRIIADALVQSYFTTMHPLFPVVLGPVFMQQYETFYQTSETPPNSTVWLAILNVIFALGAAHGYTIGADWVENDRDHVLFFIRARLLSLEPLTALHVPAVENIQLMSLFGLYLMSSCQVNRAWHAVGLSIRYAQTRGLYLINDSPEKPDAEKELEVRLWHATCSLERLLCFLTGRTGAVRYKHNSQRAPMPILDHVALSQFQGNNSLELWPVPWFASSAPVMSFCATLELDLICSAVLSELYSASTVRLSWSHVQKLIAQFNHRLGDWRFRLSSTLSLKEGALQDGKAPIAERMYLELRYFSISMLINRPCLCMTDDGGPAIPSQSQESKEADDKSAAQCVASARGLMRLFSDEPDVHNLYSVTPWWSVLHYIVQAGAVIMIEISLRCVHLSNPSDRIAEDAAKVLKWLQAMSVTSLPAFRAWTALSRLLHLALSGAGEDVAPLAPYLTPEGMPPPSASKGKQPVQNPAVSQTYQQMVQYQIAQPPSAGLQQQQHQSQQPPQLTHAYGPSFYTEAHADPVLVHMPSLPAHDFWNPQEHGTARPAGSAWSPAAVGGNPSQWVPQSRRSEEVDIVGMFGSDAGHDVDMFEDQNADLEIE